MKTLRAATLGALLLGVALLASAQAADETESAWAQRLALPPPQPTRAVITALPQVRTARAAQDEALARGQGLEAGSHEWTLRLGAQRRSESAGDTYQENDIALERSIRWGGKAQADRDLGAAGIAAAQAGYADAWHEAVRSLVQDWYAWQRVRSAAQVQAQAVELTRQQRDVATRRVQAGDAPRMDVLMAEAELGRMQAQLAQIQGQAQVLQAVLRQHYPGLALTPAGSAPARMPEALPWSRDVPYWVDRILADNHEIERAEAEVRQARLASERAGLDTRPDPTLGVHAARERGGADNVIGVYVAIPLGGTWRDAEHRSALARLDMAEQRLQQTRQRVTAAAQRVALQAQHAQSAWRRQVNVEQAMARVAQLGIRAYDLGEMTLTESLQARRAALDAALAAEAARWDALEAVGRVLVDAHQLWAAEEAGH